MLKMCKICKPLDLTFKQALTTGAFLSGRKKDNIVLCYEIVGKQNLKNYRPASLLLVLNQATLALISFYQLLRIFTRLLMMDLKLQVFSWIYLKPLIKFGIKGLYLNLSKMVFRMTC